MLFLIFSAVTILFGTTGSFLVVNVGDTQYSIETRVIVDKYAISIWDHAVHSILGDRRGPDEPRSTITDFIKSSFVGVNQILKNLEPSGIKLDARIVSIEFITDESVVTETSPGSGYVNKATIVDQFELWLTVKNYPRADHTLLLTGLKMTNTTADTTKTGDDPIGKANLGSICGPRSLSAVQNIPNGEIVVTIAHELGHSLNAQHDGDENDCSNATGNVMAERLPMNASSAYHFSSCSVEYFKNKLAALSNAHEGNCLAPERTTAQAVSGVPLGKLFSADQFCQLTWNTRIARVCRNGYGYDTQPQYDSTCKAIWCGALTDTSEGCDPVYGADGLTCGNHKECFQGVCVLSRLSPASSDMCPFGDAPFFPEFHIFSDDNRTCPEIIAAYPADCYGNARRSCCASCESVDNGIQGCEFGDKHRDCADLPYPRGCYTEPNAEVCCGSCLPHYDPNRIGCEYGDKASWCSSAQMDYPYDCGSNADHCCLSCLPYYNASRVGCEYGDQHPSCADLDYPQDCHYHSNGEICCESCYQFSNPEHVGCEFGDTNPGCKEFIAADRSRCQTLADTCCLSCAETHSSAIVG